MPYEVTGLVSGSAPDSLDDFVGDTAFALDGPSGHHQISGCGARLGDAVRFHEKDQAHSGKDVRVWEITQDRPGTFTARHDAAI